MRSPTDFEPISAADFQSRTGIDLRQVLGGERVEWVVSPRDIAMVDDIIPIKDWYRDQLLSSIGVAYNREKKIYKELAVHMRAVDPSSLGVGQKFVYRQNILSIVERFRDLFKGFNIPRGFAQGLACIILGRAETGEFVLGHYLPPIIEQHGSQLILMDGVHRNYLMRAAGLPIMSLVVEGVAMTFPCTPHPWKDVQPADKKPQRVEDRYWDLDRGLFRDLKYVGIDG